MTLEIIDVRQEPAAVVRVRLALDLGRLEMSDEHTAPGG